MLKSVELNLTKVLRRILDDMMEINTNKDLQLEILDKGDFVLYTDESLATVLLNNLLKNVVLHSPAKGKIRIESSSNQIDIFNDGSEALDTEKIFQRFYHSDNNELKSTGLALSIAKEIAQLLELKLVYSFDGQHCFSLVLAK